MRTHSDLCPPPLKSPAGGTAPLPAAFKTRPEWTTLGRADPLLHAEGTPRISQLSALVSELQGFILRDSSASAGAGKITWPSRRRTAAKPSCFDLSQTEVVLFGHEAASFNTPGAHLPDGTTASSKTPWNGNASVIVGTQWVSLTSFFSLLNLFPWIREQNTSRARRQCCLLNNFIDPKSDVQDAQRAKMERSSRLRTKTQK